MGDNIIIVPLRQSYFKDENKASQAHGCRVGGREVRLGSILEVAELFCLLTVAVSLQTYTWDEIA